MKDTATTILTRSEQGSQWKNASFSIEKFACALGENENENNVSVMETWEKNGSFFLQDGRGNYAEEEKTVHRERRRAPHLFVAEIHMGDGTEKMYEIGMDMG